MASLFDRDVKTIGKHINTIFTEGDWKRIQLSQNLRQLPKMERLTYLPLRYGRIMALLK
ncbi:MAG: hypothetical protein LBE37_14565 [Sphingobacterium sp.]|jgi:hypothetical protein|nr:hypothetical protein [Sphingobacterium sp.]